MVMKANKALKRLAKIEALMSDVVERYSASAPHVRELLQDAKAAVTRAKEAVSLRSSSGTAKNPAVEHSAPTSKATPESTKPKRTLSAAGKAAIVAALKKRWAAKRAAAKKAANAQQPPAAKKAAKKAPVKASRKAATKGAAKRPQKAAATPAVPAATE
jgi:hypothetical protein